MGALKVIPLEYPNLRCRCIDIQVPGDGMPYPSDSLLPLCREIVTPMEDTVVAYRGMQRWAQVFTPTPMPMPEEGADIPFLKEGGVYLITGGTGGMGLTMARHLAIQKKARLILTRRSSFPSTDSWDSWLSQHNDDDSTGLIIREIRDWEASGAQVMVLSVDTADENAMAEAIASAQKRFGTIDGVYHTAGIGDFGGVIQRRTLESIDKVLAAKVKGTLVLHRLFKDKELDFMILCSSLSSVIAPFGQAAYAAANSFLDIFAHYRFAVTRQTTVAVNWDAWQEVGMAVDAMKRTVPEDQLEQHQARLNYAVTPVEGIRVFHRVLLERQPQWVISTRDLHKVMEQEANLLREVQSKGENKDVDQGTRKRRPRPRLSTPYASAATPTQEKMVQIFQDFLGMEVGINDDFFELGGDSLRATQLVSRIHQKLHVKIPLAEIFNTPTIQQLSLYIDGADQDLHDDIEPVEERDYYPLSRAQLRLFILSQMEKGTEAYNIPGTYYLSGDVGKEALKKAFQQLMQRHQSLRTTFKEIDGEPVQIIHPSLDIQVREIDLTDAPHQEDAIKSYTHEDAHTPFNLEAGPLVRATELKLSQDKTLLLFNMHHIISDGVSMGVLTKEIQQLYIANIENREPRLPELPIQYRDYVVWEQGQLTGDNWERLKRFWDNHFGDEKVRPLKLPNDRPRPKTKTFNGKNFMLTLGSRAARESYRFAEERNVTLYVLFLAIFNVYLSKICKEESVTVITGTAGRNHADVENLIGLFVRPYF